MEHTPFTSAELLGVGIILLVTGGRSILGLSLWTRLPLVAFFGVTLVFTQSRTDGCVALGFAILTGLWFMSRRRPGLRTFALAYYVAGLAIFVALVRGQVFQIASRGGGYAAAVSLDGRITLWGLALRQLHSVREWLIGSGYGSPRVTVYKQAAWAGTAHSAPIELLLGMGVCGLVLFLFEIGFLGWGLVSQSRARHLDVRVQLLATTLFSFLVVHGVVASELVIPRTVVCNVVLLDELRALTSGRPNQRATRAFLARIPGKQSVVFSCLHE